MYATHSSQTAHAARAPASRRPRNGERRWRCAGARRNGCFARRGTRRCAVVRRIVRPRAPLRGAAFTPRQAAARARSLASTVEMAFVFGNERSGLSNADIERCRARVYIPASPAYNSLNLAQAVQVLTYELRLAEAARDSRLSGALAEPIRALASNEEIERMFAHFEQALLALDFFDPAQPKRLLPRLRRFFARTQLEHEEVSLMRGIAKAILQDRRIARVGIANQ